MTAAGGALEAFTEARQAGKIRNIGFSAHSEKAAIQVMRQFDFDSTLFPINAVCIENGNFGRDVIEAAGENDVAILAIKGMAWRPVPEGEKKPYANCWYQPIDDPDRGTPCNVVYPG